MKVSEYAKHRGISHVSVSAAIKKGKLTKSITRDEKGRAIIDAEIADQEWIPEKKEIFKEANPNRPVDDSESSISTAISFAESRAVRENYQAQLSKLEYEREAGKSVDADEVKREWAKIASIVRSKVLGIPSKARQRIPELTHDAYLVLETVVRESLEELSDGGH